MNRADIIRIAQQAGFTVVGSTDPQCWIGDHAADDKSLKRFFAAAYAAGAAAERKRMREEIHSCHANCDHPVCVAVRNEREECAKVCESIATETYSMINLHEYGECANAIRARGQS